MLEKEGGKKESFDITLKFVTSNEHKFDEVSSILGEVGIKVEWVKMKYVELQAPSIEEISRFSASYIRDKYSLLNFFIEDTGLFIESLNGFPGPYSSYVFKTIGNEGILKLMDGVVNRRASFKTALSYVDEDGKIWTFTSEVKGHISKELRGDGWGYDPIFIPEGYKRTYAEMGNDKNKVSHRRLAVLSFLNWFTKNKRKK
ncbi:MAG: XTP/dITP diphosphatase [Candidatus Asgardarchaeia archaeon]